MASFGAGNSSERGRIGVSATFASMRYVNYRYWFVASLIASTGAWLQRVAQDWYVLTVLTDHDASQVGVVTALQLSLIHI